MYIIHVYYLLLENHLLWPKIDFNLKTPVVRTTDDLHKAVGIKLLQKYGIWLLFHRLCELQGDSVTHHVPPLSTCVCGRDKYKKYKVRPLIAVGEGPSTYNSDWLGKELACSPLQGGLSRQLSHGRLGQAKFWHALCCIADQSGQEVGMCSVAGQAGLGTVTWQTRPGEALSCTPSLGRLGQAQPWRVLWRDRAGPGRVYTVIIIYPCSPSECYLTLPTP